jgi:hypothetical protein
MKEDTTVFAFKREEGKYIVTINGFKAVFDRQEDAMSYCIYRRCVGC